MKKINLIEWLFMDSHEKQSPQRFARYAAMLIMLLTVGVGQMWGAWTGNAGICVNGEWYKASDHIDGGNWLSGKTTFNGTNLGAITSLELGGQYDNYDDNKEDNCGWNSNNGIWITITTNGGTQIDNFKLSCYHAEKSGSNNIWKTTGTIGTCGDGSAWAAYSVDISGYAAGVYKLKVHWFSASGVALPSSGDDVATFTIAPVVTFKANGGTGSDYTQTVTYNTNTALTANTFTKTGYDFAGWATSAGGSVAYANGADVKLTNHTTLFAKWTAHNYTASNNIKHADGSTAGQYNVNYDATSISYTTTPSKTGYNLEGLYYESGLSNKIVNNDRSLRASTSYTTSESKWNQTSAPNLYAKWTAKTYSITLDDDGAYDGNGSATATYNGTALDISEHASRDGWNLVGYFAAGTGDQVTDADGNLLPSKSFSDGSSHAITNSSSQWIYDGDLTLYAHWSKEYSITYNANGGTGTTTDASSPYAAGSNVTVLSNSFTRSGYSFTGWNTSAEGDGTPYAAGATISSIAANVTLYAQWSENDYTVTVNAGSNGSVASGSVTGHKDTKVDLPDATPNTGYHFSTWTTTSGSVTYTNQTSATDAQVNGLTAAATVRADFAANTYSVVFNANGGTGTMSNEAFTYDASAKALTSNAFTRSGYTFLGWATTEERANALTVDYTNGQSVQNLTSTNGGTFNLYAVWAKDYYIGGRFQHDWEEGSATTNKMTYDASSGYYKFATNITVSQLSEQWHDVSGGYYADQYFYIHTGLGKGASSSQPTYVGASSNGHNMEVKIGYSNAYVLTEKTSSFDSFAEAALLKFSNVDNLSSDVIVWWDPANRKVWYTATESLNTNYYLLGFGSGNWGETEARRFKVASVNATTATVSVTLTAKTYTGGDNEDGFKVKVGGTSTYYGNNGTMERGNCTSWVFETDKNNCGITADLAGTYTFTLNLSTKAISVTYPTAYQLNYAIGSVNGTSGSISTSPSTATGSYVGSGNTVTLTGPEAKTGYTWKGWYTNAAGTEGKIDDTNRAITVTMDADKTLYACYTENDYTINVAATTGGTITTPTAPTTVTAHPATGATIVAARANEAWHFTGWTSNSDKVSFGDASALSTTVTTTANATVTANFVPRFGLNGSLVGDDSPGHGMPGWVFGDASDFEVKSFTGLGNAGVCLQCTCTLDPNTTYKFRVLDRDINNRRGCSASSEPDNILPAGSNWRLDYTEGDALNDAQDVHIQTVGRGTYIFHITKLSDDGNHYPSLQVERQASHLVSIGQGYQNIDGTITSNSSTGGTMAAEATESGITVGITNGKYIANGGKLDYEATPETGYTFEGWYGTSDYSTSRFATANPSNIASVTEAANVYAKFVENSTAVTISHNTHGHVTVGGVTATSTTVGITTTRALVAVPDAGYYFAGWTVPDGADFELRDKSDDEDAEVTLHGLGAGTAGTLTANFVEEDKIYFRNIDQSTGNKLWDKDNIYVYFATTWYDGKGVQTLSNYAEMSPAFDTKIYWAYVPHAFTKSGDTHVAFSDVDMHTNSEFYNNHGVYRTDYNKALNMFVPNRTSSGTTNGTVYHSNGYWKVYDPKVGVGQGYYLQLHTGDDGEGHGSYEQKGEFTAVANGSSKISYTMRVDNTSTQTQYRIASAGGVHYTANAAITTAARENVTVNEYKNCDNCYFTVTLTSEGDYTFILDQSEDYMKLTVDYPVSTGDYRLKHTYNDGSAKTTYSNVIKSSDASISRTLSMYLSTEGSETLVLQKCTAIVAGVPAWDAGDATNLSGVLTTVGTNGNGVYQFDVAVSADKVSSAPTATKYVGPYYIKTDGASGGWVNYKQNFMDENTLNYDTNHPEKSFNYYYCKYFSSAGDNLKCVIANDYCNALTDTLIGDAVIGIDKQATPSAVSVRFSYNSYTNEIKRSYLGASTTDDFLRVLGNTTASAKHIYDKDETTFNDANADSYIKFEDKQNWRYEIEINADVNARAKLTATFNSQTQYFMGAAGESGLEWDDANTEQLFGGTDGTYGLTLVYDFKTNKLIRAWRPTASTISADLSLESDVILLREHQGAPTAITFGKKNETDYASLTEVKTVYSVLRLNRWKLNNRAHPEDVNTEHCKTADLINTHHAALSSGDDGYLPQAERELYFISFPYDVKMSDIIHFGGYYDKWGIMYYDGKNRAKNGYWIDSESNWKYFTPEEFATDTLNAYEGYLIGIDLDQMRYDNTSFWTNNSSEVDIYFPSKEPVSTITQQAVTVNIDTVGYQCTINRTYGGNDGDRRIKDSHWHCIGVPAYADLSHAINGEPNDAAWTNKELLYLYEWNAETNDHSIRAAGNFNFQAMYAYLVQYAGIELEWAAAAVSPATPAARRMKTEELRDRQFNLQLMQGGKEADHTYIRLSDDEEVTTGFEFNHDVSKMMLTGANIYTLIGKEQAAANSLPLNMTQTTVVPVGVKIATAGDYTFAIPEGTDGVGVVLIDNITGARTNLALTDYTVSLTTGKIENRFSLEISPIQNTPTDIDNVQGESAQSAKARKVMIDGILYIVHDGRIYDARGNRVK